MIRRAFIAALFAPFLGSDPVRSGQIRSAFQPEVSIRHIADGRYLVYHQTPDRKVEGYVSGTVGQALTVARRILLRYTA